jgi:hypothetical protein
MPQIFDYILDKNYGKIFYPPKAEQKIIKLKNITIFPEKYFIPFRAGESFSLDCIESETTTIHWFSGSWVKENIKEFLTHKHDTDLIKLKKKCFQSYVVINNPFIKIIKEYEIFDMHIDFSYALRFKHKYYAKNRYLTIFIFGFQVKLFKH